jgi:hypothetical protein
MSQIFRRQTLKLQPGIYHQLLFLSYNITAARLWQRCRKVTPGISCFSIAALNSHGGKPGGAAKHIKRNKGQ